jgi:hypothetical protein
MSAASFISMAGLIGLSYNGYGGSVFLMGWTGGYVILAMLIAPYLRKYGKFTVPEFIGDRYYSNTARIVAVICLIICSVTYVIGQMKGIGVAFSRFLETDYETGLFSGDGHRFFLCRAWRDERDYLHPDRPVLCADFCLHRAGDFYQPAADWSARCRKSGWVLPFPMARICWRNSTAPCWIWAFRNTPPRFAAAPSIWPPSPLR